MKRYYLNYNLVNYGWVLFPTEGFRFAYLGTLFADVLLTDGERDIVLAKFPGGVRLAG